MKVIVNLYASLAKHKPESSPGANSATVDVEEATTVRELLSRLKIPEGAAKMVFLNGAHANGDEVLKEGDRIGVFPPVAGG
ncbi:MAG: MoaD/ThiS family protein [Deltaproteobacteria bacterium]|nr:MoaD/ThiS family protein [Deltaproteobacteria bacterium]